MVRGFATGSYEIASSGFVATLTADPVFALGQTTADGDSYDALSPVVETIRRWGQSRDTVPVLPASFIEYFMERYLREERIFEPDESAPDEDYAGRFERGDRMVQVMEHVKVERASAYFVRVRGGMTFGTLLPPKDEVFTGTSWMSFAQWQARERPRHRDAREGVYLEKLTGPRLEAERAFRRGVERAYRHYEVKQGLIEIEGSLLKDPWNVEALRIAAQLNAVAGLPRRCVEFAELGLELDPIAFGLATLAKDCRTAPTR
jgi:hypothetical protein